MADSAFVDATAPDGVTERSLDARHAAFLELARDELDRAYRLAGLILGDAGDAEDAVQDALLRAWRSAASLRDPTMFQAWFDRILVNGCRDRVRRRKIVRFVPIDPSLDPAAEGDPFREVLARDELLGGLDRLSADERAVVVLHYWTDLSVEQISARLGWPTGTVKSRLHRARRVLRDHLNARSREVPS